MKATIQKEVLTVTQFTPAKESGLLFTEGPNGIVKVFLWTIRSCKLLAQFNKNSIAEIEYIENKLKGIGEKVK